MLIFQATCPFLDLGSSGILSLLDTFAVRNPWAKGNVCFCVGNRRGRLYVTSLELPKELELLY